MLISFNKLRKAFLYCSGFVGVASIFAYGILENTYVNYPRVPDPSLGRIVPHKAKSVTVYISAGQSEIIHIVVWVLIVSGVLTLIGLILNLKWPLKSSK